MGYFGVGFFSVFALCDTPAVTSGGRTMSFHWGSSAGAAGGDDGLGGAGGGGVDAVEGERPTQLSSRGGSERDGYSFADYPVLAPKHAIRLSSRRALPIPYFFTSRTRTVVPPVPSARRTALYAAHRQQERRPRDAV